MLQIIFGGTFDPVHTGHVHAALAVSRLFDSASVSLFATPNPPHKTPQASATDRAAMLALAVAPHAELQCLDPGIPESVSTYTIDVLERLDPPGAPVVWILGSDGPGTFTTWHRHAEIAPLCHFLVLCRPEVPYTAPLPLGFRAAHDVGVLKRLPHGALFASELAMLPVSSTQIREGLAVGERVDQLLAPDVREFITAKGLYR